MIDSIVSVGVDIIQYKYCLSFYNEQFNIRY